MANFLKSTIRVPDNINKGLDTLAAAYTLLETATRDHANHGARFDEKWGENADAGLPRSPEHIEWAKASGELFLKVKVARAELERAAIELGSLWRALDIPF